MKEYYTWNNEQNEIIDILKSMKFPTRKSRKRGKDKPEYLNIPVSFDIETSSTYIDSDFKFAFMYIWQMAIDELVVIGRTWDEWLSFLQCLRNMLQLNGKRMMVIYVHNLGFEFQFFRKFFKWDSVFSGDSRKPIYGRTTDGFEFRCSYILSGYSLENVAKNLQKRMEKKNGQLDYETIRISKTPLTKEEIEYCVEDVKIVVQYIREEFENGENIADIPLTKTGYVRRYTRQNTIGKSKRYRQILEKLTLTSDEYVLLKDAFRGGSTHANPIYSRWKVEFVSSYDETSAYPAAMCSEEYPMSKGKKLDFIPNEKDFEKLMKNFCCLIDIEMINVKEKFEYEHILSYSKCTEIEDCEVDNGRIVNAKHLRTTITDVDFQCFKDFYDFEYNIKEIWIYRKGYLPKELIYSILSLYEKKTKLKGVKGFEVEYQVSKGMLNALFGMCVMDVVRDSVIYSNESGWIETPGNVEELVSEYNTKGNRFLFYPWGVWITAYARRNLFSSILEAGVDYVYSDTDSIKLKNAEKHSEYFEKYNKDIINKVNDVLDFYKIPREMATPKTKDGVEKPIGVWDFEGTYDIFKTIGAKRYMTYMNGELSLTVSGINKKKAIPWLLNEYNNDINKIFRKFDDELRIPADFSGKLTHTYIDEKQVFVVKDEFGNKEEVVSFSSVHLEKATSSISLSDIYIDYLAGLREVSE